MTSVSRSHLFLSFPFIFTWSCSTTIFYVFYTLSYWVFRILYPLLSWSFWLFILLPFELIFFPLIIEVWLFIHLPLWFEPFFLLFMRFDLLYSYHGVWLFYPLVIVFWFFIHLPLCLLRTFYSLVPEMDDFFCSFPWAFSDNLYSYLWVLRLCLSSCLNEFYCDLKIPYKSHFVNSFSQKFCY